MLFLRATLSVTTPVEVDTIAIPSPFNTLGSSSALAYTRKPGFEILLIPLITLSPFEYFKSKFKFSLFVIFDVFYITDKTFLF